MPNKPTYAAVVSRTPSPEPSDAGTANTRDEVIVVSSRESSVVPVAAPPKASKSSQAKSTKTKQAKVTKTSTSAPAKKPTVKTNSSKSAKSTQSKAESKGKPSARADGASSKGSETTTVIQSAEGEQPNVPSETVPSSSKSVKDTKSASTVKKAKASSIPSDTLTAPKTAKATKATSSRAGRTSASVEQAPSVSGDPEISSPTKAESVPVDKNPSSAKSTRKNTAVKKSSRGQTRAKAPSPALTVEEPSSGDEAGRHMDPDDSMYRTRSTNNRVQPASGLTTRSSARAGKAADSRGATTSSPENEAIPEPSDAVPTTPSKDALIVQQITSDSGSVKRGRSQGKSAGSDSDANSVAVTPRRAKRVKVAVDERSDAGSQGEGNVTTVDDDMDVDSAEEGELPNAMDTDDLPNDDSHSDSALSNRGSGSDEEAESDDDDDNFIDDTALESDAAASDEEGSAAGSDDVVEVDDDAGSTASNPFCEAPTPAQPPRPTTPDNHDDVPAADDPLPSRKLVLTIGKKDKGKSKDEATAATGSLKRLKGRRTFGSMIAKKAGSKEVYLGDLEFMAIETLPDVCAVTDPRLQDPELKDTYADRPNLQAGQFNPWNDAKGKTMILFSSWVDVCPHLDYDNAFNAIVFVEWHRYINISTISPCAVLVRKVPNGTPLFHLYTSKRKPAICISLVSCCESFLTRLPPSGIQHKRVGVRFHSQEWERLVGFVCTVFREPVLEAQLSGGVTQISTRGPNTFKNATSTPTASPTKPGQYATMQSPAIGTSSVLSVPAPKFEPFTLDATDHIPVYDCRDLEFNMNTDLDKLHTLPSWNEGEIPEDSCIAVAYTVSMYKGKRGQSVGFNLQWAIVFGTP